jgi:hypothetical protein
VKVAALDKELWHAGGISLLGDILAVPLESDTRSKIVFLHMLDPENPTQLDCEIKRTNIASAGAVALARLVNGKFVCAVWREVKKKPKGRLDFYVSKTDDIREGFEENPDGRKKIVTWSYGSLNLNEDRDPRYQCVNFIEPINKDAGNGVTRLYMIATENGSPASPLLGGPDIADLFEILIPETMSNSPGNLPTLRRIDTKQFFCNREYCNLNAAGGVYIDPVTGLSVYSGYHWRVDDTIRFSEFRPEPDPRLLINKPASAWINLYEEREFGGRRLSILGSREASFSDFGKLLVQGNGFDNKVSSIKYQIPQGQVYRLYRAKFFAGEQASEDYIDLRGTGKIQEIRDLNADFPKLENKISSSQYV